MKAEFIMNRIKDENHKSIQKQNNGINKVQCCTVLLKLTV